MNYLQAATGKTSGAASADEATEATEAMLALGGMNCTRCGQELNWRQKDYYCWRCRVGHCPFCGRNAQERCPHRVAHKEWSRVSLPGVATPSVKVPYQPLTPGSLLDYSDAQKRQAFGAAYPLLPLYGQGFATVPTPRALVEALIAQFARPESTQRGGGRRYGEYHFTRTPDAARARAAEALQALRDGFVRLRTQEPHANRYLWRTLTPPAQVTNAKWPRGGSILTFAPAGDGWIVRDYSNILVAWNWQRDSAPFCLTHPEDHRIHSAVFSPDGKTLTTLTQSTDREQEGGKPFWECGYRTALWVWDMATGTVIGTRETLEPSHPSSSSKPSQAFLHNGKTLISVRNGNVELFPVGADGNLAMTVDIPHRTDVAQMDVAPDGETFATTQGDHVLLWRVAADAVQTERRTPD